MPYLLETASKPVQSFVDWSVMDDVYAIKVAKSQRRGQLTVVLSTKTFKRWSRRKGDDEQVGAKFTGLKEAAEKALKGVPRGLKSARGVKNKRLSGMTKSCPDTKPLKGEFSAACKARILISGLNASLKPSSSTSPLVKTSLTFSLSCSPQQDRQQNTEAQHQKP